MDTTHTRPHTNNGGNRYAVYSGPERRAYTGPERRRHPGTREEKVEDVSGASGSMAEFIGGAGAVVLGILALIGVLPVLLTTIAVISVGGAMLLFGIGLSGKLRRSMRSPEHSSAAMSGGMGIHVLGGAATIALGILALLGIAPLALVAVAAIVAGGSLAFGSSAAAEVDYLTASGVSNPRAAHAAHQAAKSTAGMQVFVGLGAAVLGILVLANIGPMWTLLQVAMLALGAAMLLGGAAFATRFGAAYRAAR